MRTNFSIALLIFTLGVSGCGTPGPQLADLQTPSKTRSFTLTERYEADIAKISPSLKKSWRFGLFPGAYISEKENALGTFYRGPKYSVFYPSGGDRYTVRTGGIWVPNNPDEKVMLFVYFNFEWLEVANLEAALELEPKGTYNNGVIVTVSPYSAAGTVGGIVGSSIVNLMVSSSNGNYSPIGFIDDKEFSEKIRNALSVQQKQ